MHPVVDETLEWLGRQLSVRGLITHPVREITNPRDNVAYHVLHVNLDVTPSIRLRINQDGERRTLAPGHTWIAAVGDPGCGAIRFPEIRFPEQDTLVETLCDLGYRGLICQFRWNAWNADARAAARQAFYEVDESNGGPYVYINRYISQEDYLPVPIDQRWLTRGRRVPGARK